MTISLRNHLCNHISSLKTCLWIWPVFLPEIDHLLQSFLNCQRVLILTPSHFMLPVSAPVPFGVFIGSNSISHILQKLRGRTSKKRKKREVHAVPFREMINVFNFVGKKATSKSVPKC